MHVSSGFERPVFHEVVTELNKTLLPAFPLPPEQFGKDHEARISNMVGILF